MPNQNNETTWKDIFEEENKLQRKAELITLRNITDAILICAEKASDLKQFAEYLKIFRDKMEKEIEK